MYTYKGLWSWQGDALPCLMLHAPCSVCQLAKQPASKSDIIYAGEDNTPKFLSDINKEFTGSKNDHCLRSHRADLKKFENKTK